MKTRLSPCLAVESVISTAAQPSLQCGITNCTEFSKHASCHSNLNQGATLINVAFTWNVTHEVTLQTLGIAYCFSLISWEQGYHACTNIVIQSCSCLDTMDSHRDCNKWPPVEQALLIHLLYTIHDGLSRTILPLVPLPLNTIACRGRCSITLGWSGYWSGRWV